MTKLFEGVPQRRVVPTQAETNRPVPGAIAEGAAWALFNRNGRYEVDYMSGTVSGIGGTVVVTEAEAKALKTGDDDLATRIINAHGGS